MAPPNGAAPVSRTGATRSRRDLGPRFHQNIDVLPFAFARSARHWGAMQARDDPDRGARIENQPATAGLILLVEDDAPLRTSLAELLVAEGFLVDCCADGRAAFRRLHRPPRPDLMLLDIMLPHLDGF